MKDKFYLGMYNKIQKYGVTTIKKRKKLIIVLSNEALNWVTI